MIRRPEDFSSNIRSILLRDEAGCPSAVPFGDASLDVLTTVEPPSHTVHRRAVFPELVTRRMAELRPAGSLASLPDVMDFVATKPFTPVRVRDGP